MVGQRIALVNNLVVAMSDIKTVFTDITSGTAYNITDVGLEEDTSLATAVIISLFTDKRDPQALPEDARGWWCSDIGSLRWTINRSKQTNEVLQKFIQYDTQALEWMHETGLVKDIFISARWVSPGVLDERINLTLINNSVVNFSISES